MSKINPTLTPIQKMALRGMFNDLFHKGIGEVKASMAVRIYNKNESKNFSPEVQGIFFYALKQFLQKHKGSKLIELASPEAVILGDVSDSD